METPSLGAGFSYSIQGAWSYLLQIGLDLRLFYWCGSTPITRKDQANMDYSRCKQILHDFYSENGIIDHFERDNLYLEKAFHEINEMWFRNLECIKEVKYLMIAEAPLWGKDKSYIYNPETKNTQFFQKKDLERVIGLNVYNKLDFLNYCNKMGLLIIDISPFAFNTEDTIINYRNKTSNNPYGLTKYQYRGLIEQTLTTFFDIKIQAISLKKSRNVKKPFFDFSGLPFNMKTLHCMSIKIFFDFKQSFVRQGQQRIQGFGHVATIIMGLNQQ